MFEEKTFNRHEAAMGVNNPLAGGSNPAKFHRLYPNRISARKSQSQSRSNQDLVRTRMGPRIEDNLPVPSADIPEDSSKSVPNLHANEKGKKVPKTKCRYVTNE